MMNAAPADRDPASEISRLASILGNVIAPTTVLTALLFYFGWNHAYRFFEYFGVNSTLLGLSTTDYVMRSVDGLFVPITFVAAIILILLWVRTFWQVGIPRTVQARVHRASAWASPIVGIALILNAALLWRSWLNTSFPVAPLSLLAGMLLLVWTVHIRRSEAVRRGGSLLDRPWVGVLEWAAAFLLIGVSLFWAATDYSAEVGRERAREFVASLPTQPSVVLYSERSLSLNTPGVWETRCLSREAAYRFRYHGLKLVWQSDNQYLLLPAAWKPESGVAIIMPREHGLRLEFVPASATLLPSPKC